MGARSSEVQLLSTVLSVVAPQAPKGTIKLLSVAHR
ncbi:hypothetical protein SHINKOU_221 [Klebsiella phage vB_KaeM_Shinkou]|nr:hypothetical protein SHINKOU_221 [Klebsiella phage vB_KaeM_Shinkou]